VRWPAENLYSSLGTIKEQLCSDYKGEKMSNV
jgi:hypothetical protein